MFFPLAIFGDYYLLCISNFKKQRIMLGFIIWLIGVILAVKAVLDILKWNINPIVKILVAILLLATSWIGLIVYYFWGKDNLERLLK
mgnify:CR=1 FL=1